MKQLKQFKTLFAYAKEYKIRLIICTTFILLTCVSSILVGYLNGAAIEAITNNNVKLSIMFLLIYFISETFFSLSQTIAKAGLNKIEIKISRKIGFKTYKKIMKLPSYAHEEVSSGELLNRTVNDTETIINSFDQLLQIISSIIASLIILVYVFFNSYIVAIEILLFIFIFSFVVKHYNPLLKDAHKQRRTQNDKYTSEVTETLRGIREIKTLGIKDNIFDKIKDTISKMIDKSNYEIIISRNYDIISQILRNILEVGCFITCAILMYYGKVSLTFFVAMTYYIYRYTWVIQNITSFSKLYNQVTVALTRINEILENKKYQDEKFGTKELGSCKGRLAFKNVDFGYKNEQLILKKFNIEFEPNKKIAIVGKSGQGKSTLFNLITRIFDPVKGDIFIDNTNIKDLSEHSLRDIVSIVRQEPFIFNGTFKENFQIIKPNITLEEIRKYTSMAYLDDYIMSLPKGYDTIIGEGGINLSGGQKQRLSIARGLLKESKIILFDEATSALDNESQDFVKKAIDSLAKDHTVIIIAHRLSTIIDADIIYMINDGKVVASGNHNTLMETSKEYKKLYEIES